jgi:hypothetical protein
MEERRLRVSRRMFGPKKTGSNSRREKAANEFREMYSWPNIILGLSNRGE